MPADVSRAEYDAALARVRWEERCGVGCPEFPRRCRCRAATLAALGLDEPPTDESTRRCECEGEHDTFQWRGDPEWWSCMCCDGRVRPVEPPTETPKACPTCGGIGVWPARPGITPGGYCYRCGGTGETPKACKRCGGTGHGEDSCPPMTTGTDIDGGASS